MMGAPRRAHCRPTACPGGDARHVVRRLLKLMEFRCSHPAFDGVFHLMYSNDSSVAMCWRHGEYRCELFVDLNFKKATIGYVDVKSKRWLTMRG